MIYTLGYWKQHNDNYEPFEKVIEANDREQAREILKGLESCAKFIAFLD